eukprot:gene11562-11706_t
MPCLRLAAAQVEKLGVFKLSDAVAFLHVCELLSRANSVHDRLFQQAYGCGRKGSNIHTQRSLESVQDVLAALSSYRALGLPNVEAPPAFSMLADSSAQHGPRHQQHGEEYDEYADVAACEYHDDYHDDDGDDDWHPSLPRDWGSMKGADIFLFRARGQGTIWSLTDAYARGFETPIKDKQQDLTLLGVQYGNNTLTAAWRRSVTPCDKQDLPIPAATPLFVIWAHAATFGYHGFENRGSQEVYFYPGKSNTVTAGSAADATETETLQVMDLTYQVAIPNNENTYVYYYFELPSDKKYHIVRTETTKGSNLLHHGLAYSCDASEAASVIRLNNKGPYPGFETNRICNKLYMVLRGATATGDDQKLRQRRTWVAVPDTGLPMGTPDSRVIAIELHYYNPQLLVGQVDPGSGVRIYYTSKLRKHDIGLLTLSQTVLQIPPNKASVPANTSVCPAACTQRFNQPINLIGGLFHMHGLGQSGILRRFRNGKELAPVDQLHSFDYNFHVPRLLVNQVLLPGDALVLQCTFDSTGRSSMTTWGPGTLDEMCFYFAFYYPAQDGMGACGSAGTRPVAICDNGPPPELTTALYNKVSTTELLQLSIQLIAQGKLKTVDAPNPATSPYKPACNQK